MNEKIDFIEFAWVWNRTQGLGLPRHQIRMARWLAKTYEGKSRQGLLMAFRNSGKSTIVGLFCAWVLAQNSGARILVMAADYALAKKMVRNVKRIIERHPLTRHLMPSKREHWAADQFIVKRKEELRDPSMLARGLGGNITGSRADIVICDDVEVPKTCGTPAKRAELRARLTELDFVLTPGGMQLYVGTPHSFNTIYRTQEDESGETPFLSGFDRLFLPILDDKKQSAWEERFPLNRIDAIRKKTGPAAFASQMLLKPVNLAEGRLDAEKLVFYNHELEYREGNGMAELYLAGKRLISASAWWDPAYGAGGGKGDGSVIACVFTDEDGGVWLHRVRYLQINEADADQSATLQCRKVAAFAKRYFLPSVRLEKNGIGRFLPGILRQEMATAQIGCTIIEENSKRSKDQRILEAFDALLADCALNVHQSVKETPFMDEMRQWIPNGKGRDDGLDAVAGCLLSEPIRLKRYPASKRNEWRAGAGSFAAQADFKV